LPVSVAKKPSSKRSGGAGTGPRGRETYDEVVNAGRKPRGPHVGFTEPRIFTKPLRALTPLTSHGFAVIKFALVVLGVDLYPWQRALLIRALELNPDGTYRFRKVFVLVGRQNGKTTLLTVLTLWWLFNDAARFPDELHPRDFLILGTAQNLDLAEEAWDAALKRCDTDPDDDDAYLVVPDLAAEARKPVKTNGKKSLRLRNGAKYEPRAASRMGGRGKSAARVLMDEMREQQTWDVWGAVSKTKISIFNSQLWGISSAGDAKSIVLRTLRDGAIRTIREYDAYVETGIQTLEEFANTHDVATALFEWSAEPKKPLLDIESILQSNPSVGYKPMFFDSIWSDLLGDEPEATKRTEILCDWVISREEPYIDGGAWAECADAPDFDDRGRMVAAGSQIADGSRQVLGIATSGDRGYSFIGVAGHRDDGHAHIELIAQRAGMLWVVDHAVKIAEKVWGDDWQSKSVEVAVQSRGAPSADFVEPLKKAGFTVIEMNGTPLSTSAGRLKDRIRDGGVKHRSQPALNMSIENGTTKDLSGMPVWDLWKSPVDTAPAQAVTNALYALEAVVPEEKQPPPPPPPPPAVLTRSDLAPGEINVREVAF
jgi:phage terminase large subunit-like protein